MSKTDPAVILDPSQLDKNSISSDEVQPSAPPRELPKHLADFTQYADSKLCYYSEPIDPAESCLSVSHENTHWRKETEIYEHSAKVESWNFSW